MNTQMTCKTHGDVEGILDRNGTVFCPRCLDKWANQKRLSMPEVVVRRTRYSISSNTPKEE